MRHLAALTMSLVCFHAVAHAAGKKPATDAYVERISGTVNRLIDSELSKHPERLNDVSIKLRYDVDRRGRVQNVEIISAKPDRWAANTIARVLKATTFPPFPKDVLQEMAGADHIEAELSWTRSPEKPDNSAYYHYNMLVHKMLEEEAISAFGTPSHRLEIDYEFYLDAQSHLVSLKTHAKAGGQSAEQIIARSIRRLRFPLVPPQVFKELQQKPPLRIFGTLTWDPR
jgi:hypothetical protein